MWRYDKCNGRLLHCVFYDADYKFINNGNICREGGLGGGGRSVEGGGIQVGRRGRSVDMKSVELKSWRRGGKEGEESWWKGDG